ncbi:MAG TPA: LLM class flavin-dependent oxidoreductase [Chloroflexota bacterium]|nr:LLM class flavin-dependent oxidoreductase [Chloroflexota bacterium]
MRGEMGATLHTGDMGFADLIRYAQEAESLGYEGFWLTEESGKEAFALLALLAQATSRIRLATGILNFYSRTPTLLAMGASTIYRLSGGRFALGLGTGGVGFTERGHGLKIERPLRRARETLDVIRGLLSGHRFSYDGEWFKVRDYRLREGPIEGSLPLYLSALNPKMVALAARVADGFISNWPSDESLEELRSIVSTEAEAAGRDPSEVKIFTLMMTCAEPSAESSVDAMRRGVAFYCASAHYHHIAEVSGLGAEAGRVREIWESGDLAAASRLVPDAMLEKFTLTGRPDVCAQKLRGMLDAGVYPIIYPIPRRDRLVEDHLAAIRLAATYAK